MSHTVIIYGASDDLIEVEGRAPGCDEYNADKAVFLLVSSGGLAARLSVEYAADGTWEVGVSKVDETTPLLPVRLDSAGYTVRATIDDVAIVTREHSA